MSELMSRDILQHTFDMCAGCSRAHKLTHVRVYAYGEADKSCEPMLPLFYEILVGCISLRSFHVKVRHSLRLSSFLSKLLVVIMRDYM